MKIWRAIAIAIALCVSQPADADSVSIRSDDDAILVTTPWGDYAAYDQGDGTYWVGTRREYDRGRVIAISQSMGQRVTSVNPDGADAAFVQAASLQAGRNIDGITPEIEFNQPVTGFAGANQYRTVSVTWLSTGKIGDTKCVLFWPEAHFRAEANGIDGGGGFQHEDFAVPKKLLTKPVYFIFLTRGQKPAITHSKDIAVVDYKITMDTVDKIGFDAPTAKRVKFLKILDPLIAENEGQR